MPHLIFTFITLACLGAVAVLGFTMMDHDMGHVRGCIAAMPQGINCPQGIGTFRLALYHLDALKGLSLAITSGATALSLLFVLFLSVSAVSFAASPPSVYLFTPQAAYRRYLDGSFKPFKQLEFSRWLARHDNSPSFA